MLKTIKQDLPFNANYDYSIMLDPLQKHEVKLKDFDPKFWINNFFSLKNLVIKNNYRPKKKQAGFELCKVQASLS